MPNTGHSVARQRPQRLRRRRARRVRGGHDGTCKPNADPDPPHAAAAAPAQLARPAARARCARSPPSARRSTTSAASSSATRSRPAGRSTPGARTGGLRGGVARVNGDVVELDARHLRPGRARLGHLRDQARRGLAAAGHRPARGARAAGDRRRRAPRAARSAAAASRPPPRARRRRPDAGAVGARARAPAVREPGTAPRRLTRWPTARARDLALPAPARGQPGRLAARGAPEALERARDHDLPILVSIGYSACHWCHVMERESFEDAETAALMNEHFVCIKVDREERPDVDALYMEAVQVMTGQGGWPLNVFLTPAQVPFYGGTYFPPEPRHGMPSLAAGAARRRRGLARAPRGDRRRRRRRPSSACGRRAAAAVGRPARRRSVLDEARRRRCAASFDSVQGGWGRAARAEVPAPRASSSSCWPAASPRWRCRRCDAMASGGIHDQVGGGFARYSVDGTWTVPHFEKMLYDNALLARAYLHGWLVSGDPLLRRTCEETLDWALREMRAPGRRLLQLARRRLRGRGGPLLRLDDRRADQRAGRRRGRGARRGSARPTTGNFPDGPPGLERPRVARARAASRRCASGSARGCWRCARGACGPPTDDKRLARWNALMVERARRRRAPRSSAPDYLDAARDTAQRPARGPARRRRPAAAHLARRASPSSRVPRGPRVPARGAAHALRGDVRGALVPRRARRPPTSCSRASPTPSTAASSRPPTTARR